MPFGLVNAPRTFQKVMELCLGDLNLSELLIYSDDIVIFSPTIKDHVKWLDKVLGRLEDFGLKIKGEKCKLFRSEVSYLGHVVGPKGVSVDDKIKRIQEWPVPQTAAQLVFSVAWGAITVVFSVTSPRPRPHCMQGFPL